MDRYVPSAVRVTAKLMENYRVATAVAPGADFAVFEGPGAVNEVVAIGSSGKVTLLQPAPTEAGGSAWRAVPVPVITSAVCVGAAYAAGARTIFWKAPDRKRVAYTQEQRDGSWSAPIEIGMDLAAERLIVVGADASVFLAVVIPNRTAADAERELYFAEFTGPDTQLARYAIFDGAAVDLVGADRDRRPTLAHAMTPQIYGQPTSTYQQIWTNASCNDKKGFEGKVAMATVWRPVPPAGYVAVGDYLQADLDPPREPVLCVRGLASDRVTDAPLLQVLDRPPMQLVYEDTGGCSSIDVSLWTVTPSGDYRALGDLASSDQHAPPAVSVPMFRSDLIAAGTLAYAWSDQESGATMRVEVYDVEPAAGGRATGAFEAQHVTDFDHEPKQPGYVPIAEPALASHFSFIAPDDAGIRRSFLDAEGQVDTAGFASMPDGRITIFSAEGGAIRWSAGAGWTTLRGPADRTFTRVLAGCGQSGLPQVFAVDDRRVLYTAHQNPPGSAAPFTDLVPIADDVTGVALGRARDRVELYATGNGGRFFRIAQDPETTSWVPLEITLDTSDELDPLETYTTQFLIFDEHGSPAAGRAVPLWAAAPITLNVNGRTFATGPLAPAIVRPNAAGEFNCVAITSDLGAASLKVQAPGATEAVSYDPSIGVQDRLDDVDGDTLRGAVDASGQPLLTDEAAQHADAIASGFNELMAMAAEAAATDEELAAQPRARRSGRRHHPPGDASFAGDLRRAPTGRPWILDFDGGAVRFRHLDASALDAELAARRAHRLHVDWGSVWQMVKAKVAELAAIAWDGIKFHVELWLDGRRCVVQAFLDRVRQFLDAAYGVFVRIGTAFRKAFEWLAFLFRWTDILDTQEAVAWSLRQYLDFLGRGIPELQRRLDEQLHGIEEEVAAAVDGAIAALAARWGGEVTVEQWSEQVPAQPEDDQLAGTNIVMSGLLDQDAQTRRDEQGGGPPSDLEARVFGTTGYFDEPRKALELFEGSDGFAKAIDYFSQIAQHPRDAPRLVISALLEIVKAIAIDGVEVMRIVLDSVLITARDAIVAITDLLTAPLEVPFLSPLWAYVTSVGDRPARPLTLLDLLALAVALPATAVYKLFHGEAPFAGDKLAGFEEFFTADSLLERSGLGGAPPVVGPRGANYTSLDYHKWNSVLPAAVGAVSVAFEVWTDVMNFEVTDLENPRKKARLTLAGGLALGVEIIGTVATVPFYWDDYDDLAVKVWTYHLVLPVVDLVCYSQSFERLQCGLLLKACNNYGPLAVAILGGMQLVLGVAVFVARADFDLLGGLGLAADVAANLAILCKVLRMPKLQELVGVLLEAPDPKLAGRVACGGVLVLLDLALGYLSVGLSVAAAKIDANATPRQLAGA